MFGLAKMRLWGAAGALARSCLVGAVCCIALIWGASGARAEPTDYDGTWMLTFDCGWLGAADASVLFKFNDQIQIRDGKWQSADNWVVKEGIGYSRVRGSPIILNSTSSRIEVSFYAYDPVSSAQRPAKMTGEGALRIPLHGAMEWTVGTSEPPRVSRRLFGLSHAAISGCSSIA